MGYQDIKQQLSDYRFSPDELEFRAGSYGAGLVYADVRAYQSTLDQIAPNDWQEGKPELLANTIVKETALVSVIVPLTIAGRTEYGVSDFKTPPAARAQALKRAAASHGLGDYLYDSPDLENAFNGGKLAVDKSVLVAECFEHWGLELPQGYVVQQSRPQRQQTAYSREEGPKSGGRSGGFTKGQRGKLHYAGLEDDEIDRLDQLGKAKAIMDDAFGGADADELRRKYLTPAPAAGGRTRW